MKSVLQHTEGRVPIVTKETPIPSIGSAGARICFDATIITLPTATIMGYMGCYMEVLHNAVWEMSATLAGSASTTKCITDCHGRIKVSYGWNFDTTWLSLPTLALHFTQTLIDIHHRMNTTPWP